MGNRVGGIIIANSSFALSSTFNSKSFMMKCLRFKYLTTSMQSSMLPYETDQMTPFSFIFDSFRYDKVPKLMEVQHKRCW